MMEDTAALKDLKEWIEKKLPDGGIWWHIDSCDAFKEECEKLYFLGLGIGEIKDMLKKLYSAVADEFI